MMTERVRNLREQSVYTLFDVAPLKSVLMHRPGIEFEKITNPNEFQMLELPVLDKIQKQYDNLAEAYRRANVSVSYVEPSDTPPPNLIYVADLLFMTPEGVILARPASTVRAGEERYVARRLVEMGIPIVLSIRGTGTFEGADAAWLNPECVMVGTGLRTNREGATQITKLFEQMEIEVIVVELSLGAMHLMGSLRFADEKTAICWPSQIPRGAIKALQERGFEVLLAPDEKEMRSGMALNYVSLGPRSILMAAGNPVTQAFYESSGITCHTVEIDEIMKAAGGIGCSTGVLERDLI